MEKSKSVGYNKLANVSVFGGSFGGTSHCVTSLIHVVTVPYTKGSIPAASTIFSISC
jgi:hypothetical protein